MICTQSLKKILFLSSILGLLQASEMDFNLSTYVDTNPIEQLSNPEGVFGIKARGEFIHQGGFLGANYYVKFLGQGFMEPSFLSRTKLLLNADGGMNYQYSSGLRFSALIASYKKTYVDYLYSSSWSNLDLLIHLDRGKPLKHSFGISLGRSKLDFGSLRKHNSGELSINVNRTFAGVLLTELSLLGTYIDYIGYPPSRIFSGVILVDHDSDQQDKRGKLLFHARYTSKFIAGISLGHETIHSNSVVSEASLLTAKVYASGRWGDKIFLHMVIQGMDKVYRQSDIPNVNPYRDPEEGTQNQIHFQLERIIKPNTVLFIQYSYLKNETIFDRWYYEKSILELGVKISK